MSGLSDIRWGILGCGDVTEIKSGPALQKAERSSVVAVMRRDGAKAADYAKRHNVPRWYDNAAALIADECVNAIYIATPPSSHAVLAVMALKAGKPVFVEKPMGLDIDDCRAMNTAAATANQSLTTAFYRRALPRFEQMRAIIQSGQIGTPRLAQITQYAPRSRRPDVDWKVDPTQGGGGMFFDMQSHTIDWLHYVFGASSAVIGMTAHQAKDYAAEDFVAFHALFGDVAVTATCAFTVGEAREDVTVFGESGSVTMSFFSHSPLTLKTGDRVEIIDIADPPHVHQPFVERLVKHLLDGTENPCSGLEAQETNRVLGEIYQT